MATVRKEKKLSARVKKEKEELLSVTPQIDTERAEILWNIFCSNSMEPNIVRRARVFNRLCRQKTIFIDGNPIVGTLTKYKYGAQLFPEEGCAWMERTDEFYLERGRARVSPEVRAWAKKGIDLWRNSNLFSVTCDIISQSLKVDTRVLAKCGVWSEITPQGARHMIYPDYAKVLNQGLAGILAEVKAAMAKLDTGELDALNKFYFYQAASLALDGMMVLAHRYAALAAEMARKETNLGRKQELEELARVCEQVPANPARSFREAIQAFWFTMLGVWLEAPGVLSSPPITFTKCLYPFYKKDKEAGRVTEEEAIELIQFFFLQCNRLAAILPPHGFRISQTRLGLQLSLGGYTPDGEDATNDLDWLVLEAQRRIQLPEPLVNLVYHDRLSEKFLLKCVDLIRTGIGQPAFHNGQIGIDRHLYNHHMLLEEARSIGIVGCVQTALPGYTDGYWYMRLNVAKMIEFVLENGKDPLTGLQLGLQTGEANDFKTYDEFYQAFVKQLTRFIPLTHNGSRIAWSVQRNFPTPFASTLINDCIKVGKDVSDGGARYSLGDGVCMVGVVDAANSLAAVKKLVFEDRKISMRQLREALAADFEGYEDIERMCLDAPKYGNDDDYVDSICKNIYGICYDLTPKVDHLGRCVIPAAYSVAAHTAFGEYTGALPNGKKARAALADASVSAQAGTDKNGPTALAKSAARVLDGVKYGSTHFNMKFHPTALKDEDAARKLLSLIRTYFDLGGYHIQFNCVSSDTLKDAQLHPEKYKELIVRVAGFSAYFIHLDKDLQDEIIKRTELRF